MDIHEPSTLTVSLLIQLNTHIVTRLTVFKLSFGLCSNRITYAKTEASVAEVTNSNHGQCDCDMSSMVLPLVVEELRMEVRRQAVWSPQIGEQWRGRSLLLACNLVIKQDEYSLPLSPISHVTNQYQSAKIKIIQIASCLVWDYMRRLNWQQVLPPESPTHYIEYTKHLQRSISKCIFG